MIARLTSTGHFRVVDRKGWCRTCSRGTLLGRAGPNAGLRDDEGHGGAVTLIQNLGQPPTSAFSGTGWRWMGCAGGADGMPVFIEVTAPSDHEMHALLLRLITRLLKPFTRRGALVEEMGQTDLVEPDAASRSLRRCWCKGRATDKPPMTSTT